MTTEPDPAIREDLNYRDFGKEPSILPSTAPTLFAGTAWIRNEALPVEFAAAKAAALSTKGVKMAALRCFAEADDGLTDDGLAAQMDLAYPRPDGYDHNPSKLASRRKELEENRFPDGEYGPALVETLGDLRLTRRGCNARVFRITEAGMSVIGALV